MTSKKATPKKGALGQAQFLLNDGTLEVHLDRHGFRRLLQTLELLAEHGEKQDFEKSGRQSKGRSGTASQGPALTKLTFHISDALDR